MQLEKMLEHLPFEIISVIGYYSTYDDFHYFLNTNKQSFQEFKKRLIIFNLSPGKSLQYLTDVSFRERVLSLVENGWKQVNVNIRLEGEDFWERLLNRESNLPIYSMNCRRTSKYFHTADPLDRLAHIRVLTGIHCRNSIPPIVGVKELKIDHLMDVEDVRNLSHLDKLEVMESLGNIDMTPLKDIPNLSLYNCEMIENFSIFHHTRQKSLVLTYCPHLLSVESFQMIHHLELRECDNLVDVTPLYGIHSLTLDQCGKVKDISGLGGHHRLSILSCSVDMIGYESLLHIPHVSLGPNNIVDVSVLRFARSVSLVCCNKVTDVSPLANVKEVELIWCPFIQDMRSLMNVDTLKILTRDGHLMKHEEFRNHKLILGGSRFEGNFSAFQPTVKELTLQSSVLFTSFLTIEEHNLSFYFKDLQSLTLNSLGIKSVNGLGDIPHLHLKDCNCLIDITALGRNRSVKIVECHHLKDVRSLVTVPIVLIKLCNKIIDYDSCGLENVPRLKIITRA